MEPVIRCDVTQSEVILLEDIEEIGGYGELYQVLLKKELPTIPTSLSQKEHSMIKLLRLGGILQRLVIHDSEPTYAEVRGVSKGGFRYLKRIKF
jgi:hypothetical protein